MAEASITERTRQQGRRLRALRERLGVSKGRLMDVLGFRTSRAYDLYEDGTSVIRLDRVSEWAAAFGISEQEFVEAVLNPSHIRPAGPEPPWSMYDALLRGGVPLADIPDYVAEYGDADLEDQQAAVADILLMYAEIRAEAQERMLARQHCRTRPA